MSSPKILFEIEDDQSTSAIGVGDVTGSGQSELCTGGRDGVLTLYDANRDEVRLLAQMKLNGSILSIQIADANNDGQMEIVVGRSIGADEMPGKAGNLQVYRYTLSGQMELLAEHPIDRFVTTVSVTDVAGDEKNEIIAGGSDSTLRVLRMDTEDNLEEIIKYDLEDMPLTIGTCDVIGDEIDEIVTGNRDKTLRVFKAKDHALEEIEVLKLPSPVISVAAGDILGDRKMELGVVTHDGSVRVYRNEESKLDLFSKLEAVKALSIKIEELNADHMDEIVLATSDQKILFFNLSMAELNQLAEVNINTKILSMSVGDAGRDDRKEVLVGVSNGPLKIIEGLYQIIPRFKVCPEAKTGVDLKGTVTVMNVSDHPISGISGKLYWFPKDNLEVSPQQLRFDLGPREAKTIDIKLVPKCEGTVIVRPVVLMWTDVTGQVKQVTTPETAILVEKGAATAAPAAIAPVTIKTPVDSILEALEPTPFAPAEGTGFAEVSEKPAAQVEGEVRRASLQEAEELLDKLFGAAEEAAPGMTLDDVEAAVASAEAVAAMPAVVTVEEVESEIVTEIRSRKPKPPRPGATADTYSFLLKVMVTGEGAVGKTTLVNRYVTGTFERDYKTTIGSQFAVKMAPIFPPEEEYAVGVKLQVWDVAGQARFKAVRKMYYSGASGIVLVYDVTRRRSFVELAKWVAEADESIGQRVPVVCVGNKIDLPDRAVPADEAKKWAEDQGFLYMESSAKTGEGVADMFTVLAELMWREARRVLQAKKQPSA